MGKIVSILLAVSVGLILCIAIPTLSANEKNLTLSGFDFWASGRLGADNFHKTAYKMEKFLKKAGYFPESWENPTKNYIVVSGEKEDGSVWVSVDFYLREDWIDVEVYISFSDKENGASVQEIMTILKDIFRHIKTK